MEPLRVRKSGGWTGIAAALAVAMACGMASTLASAAGTGQPDTPPGTSQGASPDTPRIAALRAASGMIATLLPPPRVSTRQRGLSLTPCESTFRGAPGEEEGRQYVCGVLTVPQDWAHPDGRNLDLHYVVARATGPVSSDPARREALLPLAGGPGQSAVTLPIDQYRDLRRDRDIVLLAQRGSGHGQRLGVEECMLLALDNDRDATQLQNVIDAMARRRAGDSGHADPLSSASAGAQVDDLCWRAFAGQRLDLNQFTTANSARDVLELLRALGYARFTLHGVSYGTRLAMTIMDMLPRMPAAPVLRAVVLDSPFPPSVYLLSSLARNPQEPVLQMLDDCAVDAVCNLTYPNLKTRLPALLAHLAAQPLMPPGALVGVEEAVAELGDFSQSRAAWMPRLIDELERGQLSTYRALHARRVGEGEAAVRLRGASLRDGSAPSILSLRSVMQGRLAHYLNQTVHCNEDMGFERLDDALAAMRAAPLPQFADASWLREQAALCTHWPVAVAPRAVKAPVSSGVPTLILQGAYDPTTPVWMGRLAAHELSNSRLVIVPQQGHGVWTSDDNCIGPIATSFLRVPGAPLDLHCVAARRVRWAMPDTALPAD